jgi:hypothetical protein
MDVAGQKNIRFVVQNSQLLDRITYLCYHNFIIVFKIIKSKWVRWVKWTTQIYLIILTNQRIKIKLIIKYKINKIKVQIIPKMAKIRLRVVL